MIIYKTLWFQRWMKKQKLDSKALCKAVKEIEKGLYDANLGGGLLKKRVARQGQGKSGGFRTLIAFNKNDRCFFVFGFAKNSRSNIGEDEEQALKKLADYLFSLTPQALEKAIKANELFEVTCYEKN